jgi:hypothetical protein
MPKAMLQKGSIVPLEPLPPEWKEGTVLEVTSLDTAQIDIDDWAKLMNALCADSSAQDETAMREAIDEHRRLAKNQVRRDMGSSA